MTDDEPEQNPDDPKSHVANKRPDRFGYVFCSPRGRRAAFRPLLMQKLVDGAWTRMALFRIPVVPSDEIYAVRLARALGGSVRMMNVNTGHCVEEWYEGEPVRQTRCA